MKDTYVEIDEDKVIRIRDWMIAGEYKVSISVYSKTGQFSILKTDLANAISETQK